jgi:hypothetical protein
MDFQRGPALPGIEVIDQGVRYHAANEESLSTQQAAQAFAEWAPDKTERVLQVRMLQETWMGQWEYLPINAAPAGPLESLSWNQGGWPGWNGTDLVVVQDQGSVAGGTAFYAPDPEHWDDARVGQDYFDSYANEEKAPHAIQMRRVTINGNGPWVQMTVPVGGAAP